MTDRTPGPPDHLVYVLRCGDDTFYTGYTTDVERRLREHRRGDGAKYTRGRRPLEVVHVEGYDSRSAAMSREHEFKQLAREEKAAVVADADLPEWLDAAGERVGLDADE